jgi:hypothetical protein
MTAVRASDTKLEFESMFDSWALKACHSFGSKARYPRCACRSSYKVTLNFLESLLASCRVHRWLEMDVQIIP